MRRRTKIVATVGPSCAAPQMLEKLVDAGVDTFRLNFSHGGYDEHAAVHAAIRALEKRSGRALGILQDLQGPKIRIGALKDGRIELSEGDPVNFVMDGNGASKESIPLPHPEVIAALSPGHRLLIDDGRLSMVVRGVGTHHFEAVVTKGGWISNRKGVNLPDATIQLSPLTAKDRADLEFGLDLGVDWIALSFVQRPGDLIEARALIGERTGLIAKIEKPAAFERIDDIISLSDGIMIARGDLGVEIPPEDVPSRQKELVKACRRAAKPVIIATQMLDSMTTSPTPTRAEASDVATAIYDGADAVMLSGETAAGAYPVQTVEMMDRIIRRTEEHEHYRAFVSIGQEQVDHFAAHAVASAAVELAESILAPAIVAFTSSGTTALRIARERPIVPVLALTPNLEIVRRLALVWGVEGVLEEDVQDYDEMVAYSAKRSLERDMVGPGDLVVVVAGIPFGRRGATNNLRIVRIDSQFATDAPLRESR
jgi:pyruvate kinase